jgi:hypothetical protein
LGHETDAKSKENISVDKKQVVGTRLLFYDKHYGVLQRVIGAG